MNDEQKVDQEVIERTMSHQQMMEVGEWIAKRLLENNELIKTIPPILFAFYQTWLAVCQDGYYSKLYEENFKRKEEL